MRSRSFVTGHFQLFLGFKQMTETCTIIITMRDKLDNYREEDIVKQYWPYLTPWFTRRHGVENGKIILADGGVEVSWKYETEYKDDDYSGENMTEEELLRGLEPLTQSRG